jgi:hypothetical protein
VAGQSIRLAEQCDGRRELAANPSKKAPIQVTFQLA